MKTSKKNSFPRAMLKKLAEDIAQLISTNEGSLSILEIVEEIPYDIRADVIEGLSSFYSAELVVFYQLIKMEYGNEFEVICNRALAKFNLAGLQTENKPILIGDFYKAYATASRHTGRMTIDIAWRNPESNCLYVECFFLTFSSDGVHSFFVLENISVEQYEGDRKMLAEMVEISYAESCFLISDAFKFNVRFMSRPALGRFLYQRYLDEDPEYDHTKSNAVIRKLSAKLTPRQTVNSFFHALRCQDFNYMFSILADANMSQGMLLKQLNRAMNPGALLLEGQAEEVKGSNNSAVINAYSIIMYEHEVYRSDYFFKILKGIDGGWLIADIDRIETHKLEADSEANPFAMQVYCRVYEILDVDELFAILDRIDNIREVEELPYGMHMRVTCFEDDFNHGVSFMTGVIADMVINGDEFVVISQDNDTTEDFHNLLTIDRSSPLVARGKYELSLITAYSYLNGQYINFEDILLNEEQESFFEDGMRFITARYIVKDRNKVIKRLEKMAILKVELPGELQVLYQSDNCVENPGFLAEYILGSSWITVSAFGDKDIGLIRQRFEDNMYDALEFDGLEIREEGIFEILTLDVKKQYPDLESALKEMYLNKWYNSHFPTLSGMSPSEACQTEEGTRLLWTMFKRIKKKEHQRYLQGDRKQIRLKEYIRKVNFYK
ncbi:MAG: hypothetical protein PHF24_00620 [Syntrophomonas sp.]|nr:hypothetical protein [Syntrophomonas sp.]